MKTGIKIREILDPPVPIAIRDEFTILAATRLQLHSRHLFAGLMITLPPLFLAVTPDILSEVWAVVPFIAFLLFLAGYLSLRGDLRISDNVYRARRLIRNATRYSLIIAVLASIWCITNWITAPPTMRLHYPVIGAMAALASGYCMASVRPAAIGHLAINILPISILMLFTGSYLDFAAGMSMLIAGLFQLSMVMSNHQNIINLLELQQQARSLAETDHLTGLPNRRSVLDQALDFGRNGDDILLLLIDIDRFKKINDHFGHEAGDRTLQEIAHILSVLKQDNIGVARLGGEEFAVFGRADILSEEHGSALISEIQHSPMPHGQHVTVSIGAASGPCNDAQDWRLLFRRADDALYQAKHGGRNRMVCANTGTTYRTRTAESPGSSGPLPVAIESFRKAG